ncbi:enhanced entry virulence factor RtxA [Legionella pneumophila]|uniref:enhanced entry virulence factor RtxA n=1 Tax=Legionella pneumophila TaxID=446 RepID=UPI000DFCC7F6|nr:enhanced entry virulence factor RtxA [Legionella pneumophila]STX70670.1 structural toxin protein RtxA [Legionella pneumophila]
MLAESVIGIVRAVNGLLEKVNVQGQASLVKSGARLEEGDVLTLLSGEAYIQFINGFPEALALEKPVKLDGVSPTLQYGAEDLKEQMVQEAIAKGIDPSVILDVLGSAAAGAEAVGSGGDAFIMDPLFGFGHVTAGYPTGPISFAYEADTQQLFWFVPEETGAIAESELTQEPESIPQIPQFTTNQAVLTVFEDALPSGIADSAGQARIASSSLSSLLTSSADVAASFAFNSNLSALPTLKSGGIDLSYELSADKRTLTLRESSTQGPGAEVMKLELTADGQLTQTLMNSIDHPAADSDDGEWMRFDLSPLIDVTFTRTSNGTVLESRTLPANAVVAGIQDDVPIARAQLTNNEILLDETIGMKVGDADAANDDFNPTTTVDPFNNIYGTPLGLVQNANLLDASTSEMGGDYKNATMTHLLKITDAVSGLQTTDGTPINLFLESNGDITGRAGDVGAPAVFAIRMNPNTGAISVAQYGPIKQFDTNSHDEAVDLTGRISAVVTAKDSDGDESNAEIPIGQLIIFADDGPSVAVNVGNEAGILLTTQDADTIGTATDAAVTSANFGNVFSNTPNYGADGAGSTVMSYSLGLIAASGADSGLDSNGSNIYLYDISGTIVGSTSATQAGVNAGNTVFDLSVDGAGVVTLRQYAEIDHPIADDPSASGAPFDDQLAVLGNNLVSLTATALTTDGDGDTATASERIDLGGNVRFADDGPSVAVNVGNEAGILLTTQDADTIGTATDAAVTSANFGNVFSNTPNYGADGAGSTVMSYSLGLIAASGADSGLDSNGSNIYLYDISGTIVGSTSATQAGVNAGNTVFDLSVDGAGVVTLRQHAEIDHPIADDPSASGAPFDDQLAVLGNNLVSLTATALTTDGDGDTATASERIDLGGNVRFADDGPSVAVNVGNEAGILLTTQDADTIGTATDAAVTSANFGNVFSNTPNYGADGAGSTVMSYSLGLIAASGADSGLDSNGSNIYLYDISGTIVGSTSATQAGVNAGNTVFDLSVDGAGVVTLRQYAEIDHPIADDPSASGAPFDDQLAVLGNNLVSLTATALTTDGDGDTATASERIDLGGNVRFADDGPSVAVNVGNEAGILLTTQDADTIGTATDAAVTSANFGNVFSNTPNYGADGAGSTVMSYSLGLIAASGADSGLDSNGSNIYLYDISGTIVGSTSATQAGVNAGNTVFDLSVDGAGVVTLRQYAEIDHPIADDPSASGAPFDDQLAVLGNNLVSLTATALTTDGDGDTATASERIDLGGNVRFADDGPSVAVNVGNEAGILLTTQDADTIGTATDAAVTSANFGNVFSNTPNYGADGAGSTVMSYSLGLIAASGADSGLDSNGSNIYLYDISGTIVGSTSATQAGVNAGNTVFDLSVDGAGVVTLRQHAEIDHPIADDPSASGAPFDDQLAVLGNNLVSLTATALTTDGDGDTATASERIDLGGNVRFADDGPSVAVNVGNEAGILLTTQDADTIGTATDAAVTSANFGNVFSNTPNYGADGAGSTVMSYSLGLIAASGADSGLDSNGSNIYLYDISGTIVGSTSATQAGVNAGNTVFDLSVDGAGVVTLRQYAEIDHPIADDPSASGAPFDDQLAVLGNNLVSLTATALTTDGDGDTATASERIDLGGNVRFADDGPSVAVNVGNEAGILLTTQDADTIGTATDAAVTSANFGNVFSNTPNYGADGAGSTVMSYSLGLIAASGADSGLDSNGSNIYLYDISGTIVGSTSATQAGVNAGNTVFDLSVDGAGVVTLRQYAEIDHPIADDPSASGAPFDDQLAVLGNNLVSLTATALTTDGDGDTATASERIDLGGNVRFADDGPSVAVNVGNEAGILLTTQDADTIGTATDAAVTSANFGNVFSNTPNYGADGAGSTVMSYSLGLIAASGADSGLDSNGSNIYLYDISGTIVGSTSATQAGVNAGNTVFDLSVDGAGVVTLRQHAEIDHPIADDPSASGAPFDDQLAVLGNNLVSLTATALTTDGDGDTATASERIDLGGNVRFADDGPSVAVNVGNEAGILLTTQDADTIGTATDAAVTSANFGNVFSNTPNYGADGAGSTVMSYSLGLIAASGADSGLDSNGSNIYLYDISGTIVGSTSATQAGVNAGNTVFDLSVDGAGVVTLRQYAEIDHPIADDPSASGAPFDDQLAVLGNNLVSLTATALTTDGDGDTATASERIDLGGNVRFADDGPSVAVNVGNEAGILLTTQDADTIGTATDAAVTSANFGNVFSNTPNYGADGAGSTVMSYSLGLIAASGADSGLDSNGSNIYLYDISGTIVGSTSATQAGVNAGNTVFDLSVDGAGVVTLRQYAEIDHPIADDPSASGAPFDDQLAVLGNNLVSLTATALTTDGDGDTATASERIDLGGNVRFADDGPSVTMTVSDNNVITLNTQDADTIGAASDSDSVSFAAAFAVTPNYGADGAGTTVTTYALSVSAQGVDSGLDNNGNNIYLYNIAGSVVGSTSATQAGITTGNTIFSLGVNSGSGVVTLTQHQEVDHGLPGASSNYAAQEAILNTGLVFLNATAVTTDGDGDTATASASLDLGGNVKFDDDGPSVTMTVSDNNVITLNTQDADTIGAASDSDSVSFAAAFAVTPNYGADGAGTTVTTYALSVSAQGVDSGLDNNGNNIYLYNIAGSVVGSTSATQAGITTGNTIFSLGVNSGSGVVTLTQHQEVDHGLPGASSNYAAQEAILNTGLVFLNATAVTTDGDGDTATASASLDLGGNVKFDDDGPSVTMTVSDNNVITLNTQDADTIGAASDSDSVSFAAAFAVTPNYGADGAGTTVTTYALSVSAQGVDSGLDNNGNNIYLYNIAGSVVGSTSATQAGITTGNTIFSLGVNSGSGVVTLTQHQEVDHGLPGASSNYAAQEAILNTGLVFLNATAVTTDGDGDTATASASLDLGGNVKFDDDGPSVTMTVSDTNAITLNTQDADTIGAASDSDSVSFAAAFAVTPNYGADGAGTTVTTYALSVSAQGVDSGLDNNGNNIYLYNIAGSVVGSTSATQAGITTGNTIFSLGVNSSSGVVTLTQHQEVDHGLPGASSNYAAQEAILNTGLVFLNATAVTTDGDGDTATASASLDLGGNVKFDDDGPSVTMTVSDTNAITLNTQDADTIGAASDSDSVSFAAAFAVTPNYGADGAGTTVTTYALSVSAQGVDSGLDNNGNNIYLYNIAGSVVGSTSATQAGITTGNTIFSLGVNSGSGVVTLTQHQEVDHGLPGASSNYAAQEAILNTGLVFLNATAVTTDGDGDTATASASLDLGGNVKFDDDGPSVTMTVSDTNAITLNTQDADTIGAASDSDSVSFAAAFAVTPNYGADGAGTTVTTYALSVSAQGVDSGLDNNGNNIYLYNIAGSVVGSTSATQAGITTGNTIFSLGVNSSSGVVTLTQHQEVDHGLPGASSNYAAQEAILNTGLVFLNATAVTTDRDGDTATASASLDLGGNVKFDDDGPSVTMTVSDTNAITLNTQDADTIGAASDSDSVSFAAAFAVTPNYGADGAGTTVTTYALSVSAQGVDSGLDNNGNNIYLYNIAGSVVGSTSATQAGITTGNTIFSLGVNSSSGVVTLTQHQEVDHGLPGASSNYAAQEAILNTGLVFLNATAVTTDGDGDTATASASLDLGGNVKFDDDGPSVTMTVSDTNAITLNTQDADTIGAASDSDSVSFAAAFAVTPNYGADGAGTTVTTYALSVSVQGVDSGLDNNGNNIYLYNIAGSVVGSTSATQAGITTGNTIFSLGVNSSSGVVTLTQHQEVDHGLPGASSNYAAQEAILNTGLVFLNATAVTTDGDGDTATASASLDLGGNVKFDDDGPSVTMTVSDTNAITLNTQDADTIGAASDSDSVSFAAAFAVTPNYGADGAGTTVTTYALSVSAQGVDSGLDNNGNNIYLYNIAGSVVGSTSATQAGITTGNTIFSLGVNSSSGVVTLTQHQEVDHGLPGASSNYAAQEAILNTGLVFLNATAVTTDRDGDTATASASLDLGGNVKFDDDGPSVTMTVSDTNAITLNTQDADTIGAASDSDSVSFAAAFAVTPNYGADGAGTTVTTYALSVSAQGVDSGLDNNGNNIYLYNIAGSVVGSTSATQAGITTGNTIFSLGVNSSSGVVTLTQHQEVDHGLPGASSNYAAQEAILNTGLVFLNATAVTTDGDGDTATASASLDLGGNVKFDDDGPSVTMTVSDTNAITLNTQDADTIGAASDSDSVSFAAAFAVTPNYGADGAGTTVTTYALSVSAQGVDSGLDNNGNNIYLYNIAGSVVGSTSATQAGITTGNTIFSLGVNSGSGVVTLTQHQEVDHGLPGASSNYAAQEAILNTGLVFLNATAVTTDRDGDTATASASLDLGGNVKFDDDGPSVTMTVSDNNVITLNTQDADTIGAASDSDSVSFAAAFAVTPNYGADGAGTTVTTYALSVSAQGVDSGLDNNGNNIYLYNIAGSVVGSTSATQAGITTGNTIFSLGVNSGSGVVTLTQHQEVDHGLPGASSNYAAQEAILNTGLVFLNATAVTTDGDGDTATASASLDLGGNVKFDDDGPSVTMTVSDTNAITLNTQDADTIGAASDSDSVSFAAAFAVTPNYGADGAGTTVTTYALSVSAQGVDSGLDNNGNNIYLYNIAGSVVGSTSATQAGITTGNTIFSLGVNSSSGVVTLTQHQEVDHGLPGASSNYAAQEAILNTGLVFLNATAVTTDRDGDTATASASLDLGGNVKFDDDGPSVTMTVSDTNAITLNTQDADTIGAASDSDSVSFAAAFAVTPNYGADGAGTTVTTYALSVSAQGVDSGLDNNGNNIYLYNIAGSVVGSTSATQAGITTGNTIFSLGVNSGSGVVTLTQHQEVDHGLPGASSNYAAQEAILNTGLVFLNATAVTTDGDGDTATASASLDLGGNVKFDDDGPSVTMTVSDTNAITLNTQDADTIGAASDSDSVSFAAAFAVTPNYGADGAGTTVTTYALSVSAQGVDSGLDNNGNNIYLYNIAGSVVGSTSATQAGITTGNTIFSLGVNSGSGVVTLTQHQEVDHGLPGASSNYAAQEAILNTGLVFLNAMAVTTDGDGDTATASASLDLGGNVKFDDDGPSVTMTVSDNNVITLNTQDADTIGAASDSDSVSFAAAFAVTPNYGADGAGTTVTTYALSVSAQGVDSGLDNNGNNIYLYNIAGSVVGSTSATQAGITTGNTIFSLGVNSGSGVVTLTQHQEVDHGLPGASSNYAAQEAILNTGLVFLNATAVTTDRDGDTATASASLDLGGNVKFDDDGPVASNITRSGLANEGADTNLMLILDTSGSMAGSGIQTLINSTLELLERYEALGNVKVRIVTFNTSATAIGSVWMTVDAAKNALLGLTAGGNTNFDAALITAMNAFNSGTVDGADGRIGGAQNVSYFISDGNPTVNQDWPSIPGTLAQNGIQPSEQAAWEAFLQDTNGASAGGEKIRSYALGMGTGITVSNLEPIGFNGVNGTDIPAVVVTDISQLDSVLASTITASPISGTLISDPNPGVNFGADGGHVQSVTVNGITYTVNANLSSLSTSGSATQGSNTHSYDNSTHVLTVTISTGESLTIDMDNGSYTFTPPANITSSINRIINYVLVDGDGDTAAATITFNIDISGFNDPLVVRDDLVLTNQPAVSGQDVISIPTWALLANDTGGSGVSSVSSVTQPVAEGTVVLNAGSVAFTEESNSAADGTYNGSTSDPFRYTNTTGSQSATAKVDLDRTQAGENTLDGTYRSEILLGRDTSNDTIIGNDGNDILIGLGGNDTLSGGNGDDILAGGAGNDTLDGGAGNDTATYIDATAGVTVSLNTSSAQNTVGAGTDTLTNIENLTGSKFNDTLTGNNSANTIKGLEGNDTISGLGGNDTLDGGSGDDVIIGGLGDDILTGGSGADQFVLVKGQGGASAGAAPIDTITDFEVNIDKIVINGNNITGVSVSTPVSNTYTITVNYSDAATEHFKVTLSNSALLNDSGKTHLNGVVISGGTATIDGTIVGAVLYMDLNANNQEDEGERLGITDQYGHVEWVVDISKFDVNGDGQYVIGEARAVQTGGFDIDTGLSYEINLYGPVGSAVISPLTSLLQAQLEAGMDYETANAALVARLGLPEGTQIISFNPITGSGEVLAQNAGVMTAAIQFAEIAAIHYSTDEGHVSFAVFEAISKALLELPEGVVADFGDEGFLQSISNYLGLDALVTSDMIDYMATSQKALEASILTLAPGEDALTAISKIQHVTQGIYAQAIEMALIGYLPLDALKNMSAVLKAYADGDITDEQLNSFEDKLSAVIVNWEDNNVTDTSHQATLQTERTVDDSSVKSEVNHEMAQEVNAVINDFMDEHNISLYYYDQQAQMPQEAQEQQPTEHQAEETVMHDDVVQDLLLDDHSLTMLANNPQLNGGNGNDVLHGTTGNDFIRGGQGNDTMTGGGGVDTFFWLSGDDDGGVDTITDFKANPVDQSSDASVLNLSDLLSDADLETNSLDNYLNVSTTEEGDTAIKVDPNGNGNFDAPAQTIILEDVDLTAVFATNNSHDIVNQMIANGNLIVEQ